MSRWLPRVLGVLGGLLLGSGVLVFVAADGPHDVVYEGSYAPLEPLSAYDSSWTVSFDGPGGSVWWTAGHVIGAGLLVAGLLVLTFLGGWLLGRRQRTSSSRD